MMGDFQEKVYLAVPYAEKDEAKNLGARWDSDQKSWYATSDNEELIARYGKVQLYVPFDQKDEAKSLGAMWDPQSKRWCCARSNTALTERFMKPTAQQQGRSQATQAYQSQIPDSFRINTGFPGKTGPRAPRKKPVPRGGAGGPAGGGFGAFGAFSLDSFD